MTSTVLLEKEDRIAWLRLNRPEALNAQSAEMAHDMLDVLAELGSDREVKAVILTGEGRAFSTGIDLKALGKSVIGIEWFEEWQRIFRSLERLDVPLIIAARGYCLGGGLMLLLTGDYRVVGDDLRTGLSAVKHGIIPGLAPHRLADAIGGLAARRLCLFCEEVDAAEALRLGLVDQVVPSDQVEAAAMVAAERILAFSPTAIMETKRLLAQGSELGDADYDRLYCEAQQRCLEAGDVKPWRRQRP
jgi:enoyl-CoA hydratase/carnithine racemase